MRDYQTKANAAAAPDSIIPEKLGAGEANSFLQEGENAVSRAGLSLAPADGSGEDVTQLAQALMINGLGANSFQDNGVANAVQLTPITGASGLKLPPSYATLAGAQFSFIPAFTNSAATTASVGQTTGTQFAAKSVVTASGSALVGGELVAGSPVTIQYDLGNDRFFIVSRTAVPLLVGTVAASGVGAAAKSAAHGFGAVPSLFYARFINVTTDAGYTTGQVLDARSVGESGGDYEPFAIWADTSNIYIRMVNPETGLRVISPSGVIQVFDTSKWNIQFWAVR